MLIGKAGVLLGLSRLGLSRLLHLVNDVGRNLEALFGCTGGDISCRLENFGHSLPDVAGERLLGTFHDFARLRCNKSDGTPAGTGGGGTSKLRLGAPERTASRLMRLLLPRTDPRQPSGIRRASYMSVISTRHHQHEVWNRQMSSISRGRSTLFGPGRFGRMRIAEAVAAAART